MDARNEKIIGKSLAAKLTIYPTKEVRDLLNSLKSSAQTMFIVSEFKVSDEDIDGTEFESGKIKVEAKIGHVCERCWKTVDEVDENGLCPRCSVIIKNMEK